MGLRTLRRVAVVVALTGLFVIGGASLASAGSVDSASVCTDGTSTHYDIQVTTDYDFMFALDIAADDTAFSRVFTNSRIMFRYDVNAGSFVASPRAWFFGSDPNLQRWVEGTIPPTLYTLENVSGSTWRFAGTIANGTGPFSPGDVLTDIGIRDYPSASALGVDSHYGPVTVSDCNPSDPTTMVVSAVSPTPTPAGTTGAVTITLHIGDDVTFDGSALLYLSGEFPGWSDPYPVNMSAMTGNGYPGEDCALNSTPPPWPGTGCEFLASVGDDFVFTLWPAVEIDAPVGSTYDIEVFLHYTGIPLSPTDSTVLEVGAAVAPPSTAPTLTLVKNVTNDDGGTTGASAWTLNATGSSASISETGVPNVGDTVATVGPKDVTAGVSYVLSESANAGYAAGDWSCSGDGTFDRDNDTITLANNESATCQITNDDIASTTTTAAETTTTAAETTTTAAETTTTSGSEVLGDTLSSTTVAAAATEDTLPATGSNDQLDRTGLIGFALVLLGVVALAGAAVIGQHRQH